jgi:hypothetical protein
MGGQPYKPVEVRALLDQGFDKLSPNGVAESRA